MKDSEICKCEQILHSIGGVVEWCSDVGLGIRFEGGKLRDDELPSLKDVIPNVVWFDLFDTLVTNTGLMNLKNAGLLEDIRVPRQSTVEGIRFLVTLPNLATINISETNISATEIRLLEHNSELNIVREPQWYTPASLD